jgi:DnaJ domain
MIPEGMAKTYYQVLQLGMFATPPEIEEAYQRLMREAWVDKKIDREEVEKAYKILINPQQKSSYDSWLEEEIRRAENLNTTGVRRRSRPERKKPFKITLRQLSVTLLILLIVAAGFFAWRYGYQLKNFHVGQVLIYKNTGEVVGTIIAEENSHSFGTVNADAFLIKNNDRQFWLPKYNAQILCKAK